jgi:hypothetical protein
MSRISRSVQRSPKRSIPQATGQIDLRFVRATILLRDDEGKNEP